MVVKVGALGGLHHGILSVGCSLKFIERSLPLAAGAFVAVGDTEATVEVALRFVRFAARRIAIRLPGFADGFHEWRRYRTAKRDKDWEGHVNLLLAYCAAACSATRATPPLCLPGLQPGRSRLDATANTRIVEDVPYRIHADFLAQAGLQPRANVDMQRKDPVSPVGVDLDIINEVLVEIVGHKMSVSFSRLIPIPIRIHNVLF
jgi:hypothetical protein